ncbi:dihydrolipoamide acetyltransferase family protein [Jeotgalibacillus soli]|uniref:Dihydrolipoamide acetyltransferase component of pyruvate dehydrogenase complex n=1 Tax=Jeotgalibacillus soli TaxID=889306 RepID=A0A0C2W3K6_9BACL|nr:dihydrolipoamide acetyltransferase family protein [Jeotgalibacillus soli]KIL50643.1 hypothetical protein KP78_06440 [Jeotgalibacillus soli]
MYEVKLPQTSENESESVIVFWHKGEGDAVQKGDVLVEVQTEKAVFEVKSETSGILAEILMPRGEVATVGDVLATIDMKEEASKNENESKSEESMQESLTEETDFVRVSPRIRRLAKELGVSLKSIKGTGRGGQPTEEEIQKAAAQERDDPYQTVSFTGYRKTVAKRMLASLQSSAQLTETAWADVTLLDEERKRIYEDFTWNDLLLFAVTKALQEHPNINAHVHDEEIHEYKEVHLGVAVDTENGLYVPVIKNADELTIIQLKEKGRLLIEKAKNQKLSPDEQSGASFTVTNLGRFGIQFFTPIINRPEAAILGIGKIETDLVLKGGEVTERKKLPLSLTFDHRAIDGVPAAKFLYTVIDYLQDPTKLVEKVLMS